MTNGDMIICAIDTDGTTGCADYFGVSGSVPQTDANSNDVTLADTISTELSVVLTVTRALSTGDEDEDVALSDGATITYGYAYGPFSSGTFSAATTTGSVESTVGNAVYMTLTIFAITVFGMML